MASILSSFSSGPNGWTVAVPCPLLGLTGTQTQAVLRGGTRRNHISEKMQL